MQIAFAGIFLWLCCLEGLANGFFLSTNLHKTNLQDQIIFRLYTRKNVDGGVPLVTGDRKKLQASGFNGSLPTKLCVHGFMDNANASFVIKMGQELLKTEPLNYITIDWSECAKNVQYEQVVACLKQVGIYAADFFKFLQKEGKLDVNKTHLIGHSLGAHLVAFIAKGFGPTPTFARISGLDPAGPLFEHGPESERLNPQSAKFVDVIHTCRIFTGMVKPVGTVDFYPNGGYYQPGCASVDLACHHRSSVTYFLKTIPETQKKRYIAKKCLNVQDAINGTCFGESAKMGYYTDKSTTGIYYLKVSEY